MTPSRAKSALVSLNIVLIGLAVLVPSGEGNGAGPESSDGGAAKAELAAYLHVQWVRELPPLKPAWPDQQRLQFDAAYVPVVHNHLLYLASSRTDSVTAYDPDSGAERWRFLTDGPVRFAPVGWRDRLFVVSDDGHLYCLDAVKGTLLWKFRGGPNGRRILGNERLVSTWPARGAPVVADGMVYFGAGIWPFMGIFLHAVDARTGRLVWTNDGDGSTFIKQPHQSDAFAGVAPQGQLVVADDLLLVPGGRSVPACYDRRTGKLVHYRLADNSKRGGGPDVVVKGDTFFNGGAAFDLAKGDYLGTLGEPLVLSGDRCYACTGSETRVFDLKELRAPRPKERLPRLLSKDGNSVRTWSPARLATAKTPPIEVAIRVGNYLVGAGPGRVFMLRLPLKDGTTPVVWEATIQGRPANLTAAEGRLYVSTKEGLLHCFGEGRADGRMLRSRTDTPAIASAAMEKAKSLLAAADVRDGYCIVWGSHDAALVSELTRRSELVVTALEQEPNVIAAMREELIAAGLYGTRAAVTTAEPNAVDLPPYLASLIVMEEVPEGDDERDLLVGRLYESLRPFGGVLCLPKERFPMESVRRQAASLAGAQLKDAGDRIHLVRAGPLPGAGDWTHEHADAANTRVSLDERVKAPLGLLWFGGPSHDGILPRHGHGPQPQVCGGRLFIEGVDKIRAIDIYTGRLLWEVSLPGIGKAYDNLAHQPGSNAGGANYVSTPEGIFVAYGPSCLRLDPATGRRLSAFPLPEALSENGKAAWSFVRVSGDYLIGGVNEPLEPGPFRRRGPLSSSRHLVVMNRATGNPLWTATAERGFRNNAVCVGGGRLYAIDRASIDLFSFSKKKAAAAGVPRLTAFDLATGKEIWTTANGVFGTWLSYAEKQDILLESGWVARDTLVDEPKGIRAYAARTGKEQWRQPGYSGPVMIHGDRVFMDSRACDLKTGVPIEREDALTGKSSTWSWSRTYGCSTPMASRHLLTFRSGAAGYFDLCRDGGTGNFGGFRSGCTNNLVVAGGVLCAPDYTRTCTCSYQNQASLALAPMADAEMWTFYGRTPVEGDIRRVGINLGAPGNRKAENGTLWLEYPSVGGPSPRLAIRTVPAKPEWFRRHSSQVEGELPWVAASGAKGLTKLAIPLGDPESVDRLYTVRLHFMEPDGLEAGRRIFHVLLQGQQVLSDFDVSLEAGGPLKGIVREFKGISVGQNLIVTLTPTAEDRTGAPVLCGVEIGFEP